MARFGVPLAALGLFALLLLAYANHFENGFHFDDTHAIVDNTALRSVRNVPRYFVDATTFSVLPLNQSYRPVPRRRSRSTTAWPAATNPRCSRPPRSCGSSRSW
jgi:hypothetical protein